MSKKHALLTYVGESKKLIPSLREKLSCYLSCSSEKSNFIREIIKQSTGLSDKLRLLKA